MIAQGADTYNTICDKSLDSDIVHISVLISTYPTPIIINKAPICVASEIAKSISLTLLEGIIHLLSSKSLFLHKLKKVIGTNS